MPKVFVNDHQIEVPEGLNRVQVYINFTNVQGHLLDPLKDTVEIEPMVFATMYDGGGKVVANAPSFSYDIGKTYIETTTFNASGGYRLDVTVYYGIKGLHTFFGTDLGISRIESTYDLTTVISRLSEPHLALFPDHSMMAAYTTNARSTKKS